MPTWATWATEDDFCDCAKPHAMTETSRPPAAPAHHLQEHITQTDFKTAGCPLRMQHSQLSPDFLQLFLSLSLSSNLARKCGHATAVSTELRIEKGAQNKPENLGLPAVRRIMTRMARAGKGETLLFLGCCGEAPCRFFCLLSPTMLSQCPHSPAAALRKSDPAPDRGRSPHLDFFFLKCRLPEQLKGTTKLHLTS